MRTCAAQASVRAQRARPRARGTRASRGTDGTAAGHAAAARLRGGTRRAGVPTSSWRWLCRAALLATIFAMAQPQLPEPTIATRFLDMAAAVSLPAAHTLSVAGVRSARSRERSGRCSREEFVSADVERLEKEGDQENTGGGCPAGAGARARRRVPSRGARRATAGMEDTFKAFGEQDFDVKAWVNAQVRASEALAAASGHAKGTSVDDHLSTLVVKLQLLTQSSSKSIDEHSTVRRPQRRPCPRARARAAAASAVLAPRGCPVPPAYSPLTFPVLPVDVP